MMPAYSIRFLLFFACLAGFQAYATADTFDVQTKRPNGYMHVGTGIDTAKAQPPQNKNIKEVPKSKRKSRPVEVAKEEKKEAVEKAEKPQKTERPQKDERPEIKRPEIKERPETARGKGNGKN